MTSEVISKIVKKDLCIGCGLCAVMCPDRSLKMHFNNFGEYNPCRDHECIKDCGLCLKVCPFADGNDNEDSIAKTSYGSIPGICHRPETGYYLDCYTGYSPKTREQGASGGMATWFLSTLLEKGIVDYIIAVVPNEDPYRLFKFAILTDSRSVLESAGSVYYPVELSGVLQEIQDKPGKCAVIGLPCFIKAIRLAASKNRKLRERIVVTAGLVCGQMKSKYYTEYLSTLSGVVPPLKKVHYRGKSQHEPARNFYFSCTNTQGEMGKIFNNEGVSQAWVNRWFTPNACNYCDDTFAECADVTFMDAWLPEYSSDYRGTNIILVRSVLVKNLFEDEISQGNICVHPVSVQTLIQSQEELVHLKRGHLAYRLSNDRQRGFLSPEKRVAPKNIWMHPVIRREIKLKEDMRITCRNMWVRGKGSAMYDLENFHRVMTPFLLQIKKQKNLSGLFILPVNAVRFIQRKILFLFQGW